MANEFCYNASADYATHCIYRDSCYLCHATCKTKEESMMYNNYPMQYCMSSRNGNQEQWLRSRWIRPEDLKIYNTIGINYFKVSGRTGGTPYIIKVLESYMNEKYEKQMKKGVLEMLVLKLLLNEPKYGYQIIQEMKEKSEEVFLLKDGTLYPILYRLEDDGLVESEWSETEGRQVPRKYYRITSDGIASFEEIRDVWMRISGGVNKILED